MDSNIALEVFVIISLIMLASFIVFLAVIVWFTLDPEGLKRFVKKHE